VLTEVKAYSSWLSAPELLLDENGSAETDIIQVRNIDGLDPVKASVNTTPFGSVDGTSYVGSSVLSRNIVLTVRPNPDWDLWSYSTLRRLIYSYFMPKRPTRLVFYSDDLIPVEISGVVEAVDNNQFSKDPEFLVSVVCPDPYFTSLEPIVLTGQANAAEPEIITYEGSVEAGIHVKVTAVDPPDPTGVIIQVGDPAVNSLDVLASVDNLKYFEASSVPRQKYVQNVNVLTGVIDNLLSKAHVEEGSSWPMLQPGENKFFVITDNGTQDWELTYFARFGGL
jgi:Phage tail protein